MNLKFEEISLRDGMQQFDIPSTNSKQMEIFNVLSEMDISFIEFRMIGSTMDLVNLLKKVDTLQKLSEKVELNTSF